MKHIASSISKISIIPIQTLCQQEVDMTFDNVNLPKEEIARRASVLSHTLKSMFSRIRKYDRYKKIILEDLADMMKNNYKQFLVFEHLIHEFTVYHSGKKGFFKSHERIARDVGVSVITVRRTLDRLWRSKAITKTYRWINDDNGNKIQMPNHYGLNTFFYDNEIVALLEPLLPGLKACQLANEHLYYDKAKLYIIKNKNTPLHQLPTLEEFYANAHMAIVRKFQEDSREIKRQNGSKVSGSTYGVKKKEQERRTKSLNGIVYDANNLEERSVFDVKERTRTFPKRQEKPKEYTPPSHVAYKPSTQRTFGPNGYDKIPDPDNAFLKMFPIPDHVKANDHC